MRRAQRSFFGQFVSVMPCPTCHGEGEIISTPCKKCRGEGRLRGEHTVPVQIPAGVATGQYMTLRGVGNAGPRGGPRGDVLVVFDVKDDPRFERDGEDLYCEVLVTYPQLVFGGDVTVPTIGGTVSMRVPPGTRAGRSFTCGDAGCRASTAAAPATCTCACSSGRLTRSAVRRGTHARQAPRRARGVTAAAGSRKGLLDAHARSARRVTWYSLRVESAAHRDEAMAALFAAGAQGVEEVGPALVTSFPDEAGARAALAAVLAVDSAAACNIEPTDSMDWSEAWRDHARRVTLGSLMIAPPWLAADLDPGSTIVIDPGMAFGTGDHASTRGAVLMLLEALREGMTVADLGSGSAVLSIAAAKLGASRVWAIEVDPEAQGNAEENVVRNERG